MRLTRAPSRSAASSRSHSRPQMTLMTFQPAPRKNDSSSWMILPFPRTGPSSRCRLQLTTKVRMSSSSRAATPMGTRDSLQVEDADEGHFLRHLARRDADGAERLGLVHLAVAEERPDLLVGGV